MSIKKGSVNIGSIKKGNVEIGKAYLGNKLVFNHDAPVWLYIVGQNGMSNQSWWYSKNGTSYTKLTDTTGNANYSTFYCKNRFAVANTGHWKYFRLYNLNNLRNGNLSYTTINVPFSNSSANIASIASNGDKVILASPEYTRDNYLYYSLDRGITWSTVYAPSGNDGIWLIKYIGDNKFLIYSTDTRYASDGYKYWDASSPTSIKTMNYKLPDNTTIIQSDECTNIIHCNDGRIYLYDGKNYKLYYGTYSQATGEVTSPAYRNGLLNIVNIYNKYYAISGYQSGSYDIPSGATEKLYTSTDGITFTELQNGTRDFFHSTSSIFRGGTAYVIQKSNGKLSVACTNGVGVINSDNSLTLTNVTSGYSGGPANLVSNRFPKI